MGSQAPSAKYQNRRRPRLGDVLYYSVLASLMLASGAFPFYVHYHQDEFGPPLMEFYGAQDLNAELTPSSPVYQRKVVAFVKPRLELDRLATGTIGRPAKPDLKDGNEIPPSQLFPDDEPVAASALEIMFVGAGRVLAVDQGRLVTLRQGSMLADGSRIQAIDKADGGWKIVTSTGRSMFWSANR